MLHGDDRSEGGADGQRDVDEDALRRLTALRLQMLQDKMHAAQQEAAEVDTKFADSGCGWEAHRLCSLCVREKAACGKTRHSRPP
jgi:hypothetical protein